MINVTNQDTSGLSIFTMDSELEAWRQRYIRSMHGVKGVYGTLACFM